MQELKIHLFGGVEIALNDVPLGSFSQAQMVPKRSSVNSFRRTNSCWFSTISNTCSTSPTSWLNSCEIARSLDFLATSQRDIPERQRSLRAVFDSSWARLTTEEQNAFLRLSTFLGGFTLPAAQAVAECPFSLLASLTDRSFVQRDPEGRYSIHEVLRQYADEKLRAAPQHFMETQDKHSAYYTGWLAQVESSLAGAREGEILCGEKCGYVWYCRPRLVWIDIQGNAR